ncbi:glycine zipper 2TM domain-containing protein [Novosphingobium sp. Gsoil 351]|nr:glycine zipper 2TM domain-containing protein [Novosphingobium sp. Gsoil 351]
MASIPLASAPAATQTGYRTDREVRECNRELRRADSRAEYRRELRECRRELAKAQRKDNRDWRRYAAYDYNRYEPGYRYYDAQRYYRDGSYYRPYTLSRTDRIYRGNDGRYYCRRNDGTTGLIVGAAVGGLLGNQIARGRSNVLGTIIGAGAGAALGREVERGRVRCN